MSATPVAIALTATFALGLTAAGSITALEAGARASGAADAAALAAADALLGWVQGEPCALAAEVAEAAFVQLAQCEVHSASGQVRVRIGVQTIFGKMHARARAGPPVA